MNDIFIKLDNLLKEDTNNDNFKIWFGSSKVLDESGNPIYGEPYKLSLSQNDFSLMSDDKWFLLADKNYKTGEAFPSAETLAAGVSKGYGHRERDGAGYLPLGDEEPAGGVAGEVPLLEGPSCCAVLGAGGYADVRRESGRLYRG